MAEIFLDPTGFDSQRETLATSAEGVKDIMYDCDGGSARLSSIDAFAQCVDAFNALIKQFGTLLDNDDMALRQVKMDWMNADSDIAAYTVGEMACAGFNAIFSPGERDES